MQSEDNRRLRDGNQPSAARGQSGETFPSRDGKTRSVDRRLSEESSRSQEGIMLGAQQHYSFSGGRYRSP